MVEAGEIRGPLYRCESHISKSYTGTEEQMTQPRTDGRLTGQPPLCACHELQARPPLACPLLVSLDSVKGFRVSLLPSLSSSFPSVTVC